MVNVKILTGGAVALVAGGWLAYSGATSLQDPVTLTGCLRTGSAPTVYILRGASAPAAESPDASGQMTRDYLVVSVPQGTDLNTHLNHRIAVTGQVHSGEGAPAPPEGANAVERALRRISAQSVSEVASNCG